MLRLLPAGAVARWDSHPLELSRLPDYADCKVTCHASAQVDVIALGIVSSPSSGKGPVVKDTIMEQLFRDFRGEAVLASARELNDQVRRGSAHFPWRGKASYQPER